MQLSRLAFLLFLAMTACLLGPTLVQGRGNRRACMKDDNSCTLTAGSSPFSLLEDVGADGQEEKQEQDEEEEEEAPPPMMDPKNLNFTMSATECVNLAVKFHAYDKLVKYAYEHDGQADCSLLSTGPCSLVTPGFPHNYPDRNLGVKLQKQAKHARTWAALTGQNWKTLVEARPWPRPWSADSYTPNAYTNPNAGPKKDCLGKTYADEGWADPMDKSIIGTKGWEKSLCYKGNPKLGKTFPERKKESWCTLKDGTSTIIEEEVKVGKGKRGRILKYLKNPQGRTGLAERGSLGLWGPNKAGDPVVVVDGKTLNRVITGRGKITDPTKWMRDNYELERFEEEEFYVKLIRRADAPAVGIPGGMVDPGESGLKAAIREFVEEAANELVEEDDALKAEFAKLSDEEKEEKMKELKDGKAKEVLELLERVAPENSLIYRGLVDDARNTDDAWMETEAYLINLSDAYLEPLVEQTTITEKEKALVQKAAILGEAGDDAAQARWVSLSLAAGENPTVQWHTPEEFREKAAKQIYRQGKVDRTEKFTCCFASHRAIIQLAALRMDPNSDKLKPLRKRLGSLA